MSDCPCCSGKTYASCCEAIIKNESASTALTLMRSRYTAYNNVNADYLYYTTHPKTRVENSIIEIENWSKENSWSRLEILDSENGKVNDKNGTVEFKAYFSDKNGSKQIHHEKSTFLKKDGKWFYLEGIANPPKTNTKRIVARNEPCPCGSGKKFKKCCG
jgi:SEC-C motif-containing protein